MHQYNLIWYSKTIKNEMLHLSLKQEILASSVVMQYEYQDHHI